MSVEENFTDEEIAKILKDYEETSSMFYHKDDRCDWRYINMQTFSLILQARILERLTKIEVLLTPKELAP
jgi:hypothetical protein